MIPLNQNSNSKTPSPSSIERYWLKTADRVSRALTFGAGQASACLAAKLETFDHYSTAKAARDDESFGDAEGLFRDRRNSFQVRISSKGDWLIEYQCRQVLIDSLCMSRQKFASNGFVIPGLHYAVERTINDGSVGQPENSQNLGEARLVNFPEVLCASERQRQIFLIR